MGIIGGRLGHRLLHWISSEGGSKYCADGVPEIYQGRSKLEVLFGPQLWECLADKIVIDFGCGYGGEVIDIAQHGARKAIGLDLREHVLAEARRRAQEQGVADRCIFATATAEKADVIMSVDAFEHFSDPADILRIMRGLIKEEGRAIVSFGPTWYHPIGGHSFSVFPWAHLIFTESALLRWHRDFKGDGATRFREVEGGLNQMTIRGFERIVAASDFEFENFEAVPIRRLRFFHNRITREFCSSLVRCRLKPRLGNS
jgi:2-polyprenyl-3-methyl-5-hydroxy-6-metoxy-1,4-benzoquinol methylase